MVVGKLVPVVAASGTYSPRQWAQATVDVICETNGNPATLREVNEFKALLVQDLLGYFAPLAHPLAYHEAQRLAVKAGDSVAALAGRTRWALPFSHPVLRVAIQEVIARNLVSASNIAAKATART